MYQSWLENVLRSVTPALIIHETVQAVSQAIALVMAVVFWLQNVSYGLSWNHEPY